MGSEDKLPYEHSFCRRVEKNVYCCLQTQVNMRSCLYSLSIISFLLGTQFYSLSWPAIKKNNFFKLVVANLPSTLMKKRPPIRSISPPTTSIALFWVLLQYFQVLGYKQIFFPAITDYTSPSPSLHSLPHTRNPWPSPYNKFLTTELTKAGLHTCPCNPASSGLSSIPFNHLPLPHSSMHPSVPQSLFLTPVQQNGNHQAVPSPKMNTAYVPRAATEASAVAMN